MAVRKQEVCPGVTWVDISEPEWQEMQHLSQEYGLNEHTVRDCLQPEHLPKYEWDGVVHFFIFRYHALHSDKRLTTIQQLTNKIAVFYKEDFLITIHRSQPSFIGVIRQKLTEMPSCNSAADLLMRIAWNVLETYDDPADRLSEEVDFYESQMLVRNNSRDYSMKLYRIKREASLLHKVLMLMSEPVNHIQSSKKEQAALQDVRDQHLKMLTLYSQVLDDASNLRQYSVSFAAQRTNEVMRILTLFSVFFLPLTFIVGIYGMNFRFMPEIHQRWGYPAVWVLMALVTVFIYSWFRKNKWL